MTIRNVVARTLTGDVVEFTVDGNAIRNLSKICIPSAKAEDLPWVTQGLFDLQVNGSLGISFNNPDIQYEDICKVISHCLSHGMTGILATLVTTDRNSFRRSLEALEKARRHDPVIAKVIAGYHIEGPAISALDGYRGAHPAHHTRVPTRQEYAEWMEASHGMVRMVTLAPEREGSIDWIKDLVRDGIRVAIGHSAATPEQIDCAAQAGVTISTHLGNGCAAFIDRHQNPIWPQLADERLVPSIITDRYHIPESVIRTICKVKGANKVILTCDASPLAGLMPGIYQMWEKNFEVHENGKVTVPGTPYLAGSGHYLDDCVKQTSQLNIWKPFEIIAAASSNPLRELGLPDQNIQEGQSADFILWQGGSAEWKPEIADVCFSGRWVDRNHEASRTFL